MPGLKVANIASAIWPNLPKAEGQSQPVVRDHGAKPTWGESNDPMWSAEPRPIPRDYSKVPGLVKKSANRR
jgi:hypothetical protein